jgi:hypothetical protein
MADVRFVEQPFLPSEASFARAPGETPVAASGAA